MAQDPNERWQAYDELGRPIAGRGLTKDEAFAGALHAASHVWIWRRAPNGAIEVLVQRRAPDKRTWPDLLDISAAGHVDLGETAAGAAIREAQEEIGLTVAEGDLRYIGSQHRDLEDKNGNPENEFCFLYVLELRSTPEFALEHEVASVQWLPLSDFREDVLGADDAKKAAYVPHGNAYYGLLCHALDLFTSVR